MVRVQWRIDELEKRCVECCSYRVEEGSYRMGTHKVVRNDTNKLEVVVVGDNTATYQLLKCNEIRVCRFEAARFSS